MARDRSFCEADVLSSLAEAFAEHGYTGTSVATLTQATGLGKQSLYNAFGDKESLYLRALDHATERYAAIFEDMRRAPSGRAAIALLFAAVVEGCLSDCPTDRTCMVSAGLLEGANELRIADRLQRKWSATHEALRQTLERGQRDGSIRNQTEPTVLADYLMSCMSGLRVNARVAQAASRLEQAVALHLDILDRS
jgi:TetR/AcrR family transcriptional repressor of nem operon